MWAKIRCIAQFPCDSTAFLFSTNSVGVQVHEAKRQGVDGLLAAPLMDSVDATDVAVSDSASVLAPVNTPSTVAAEPLRGPPTPLLKAIGTSRPLMAPDLCKLFSLYYHDHAQQTKAPAELKVATTTI